MSAEIIRCAIFSALAVSPALYVGCKEPEAPAPLPPPAEAARPDAAIEGQPVDAGAALEPRVTPVVASVASTSTPTPAPAPAPTPSVVQAPAPPEPPTPKPSWCKATTSYCIPAHRPPPTFANVPAPPPGARDTTRYDAAGCVARSEMPTSCSGMTLLKGPFARKGECCYEICQGPVPPCGRPLVVEGIPRVPRLVPRGDWGLFDAKVVAPLEGALAARLRDAWLADAAMEHASIASFARLSLELVALGAPPSLVRGAHEAALDEIEHARLAFGLARAVDPSSPPMGPAPFALAGSEGLATTLEELVAATVRDGCVGESFAALVAAESALLCAEPCTRAVLSRIAEDERAHAAFAFRVVAWAIGVGGAPVRDAAQAAFDEARRAAHVPLTEGDAAASMLEAHGRLGASHVARLRESTFREIVVPAMAALLATPSRAESVAEVIVA